MHPIRPGNPLSPGASGFAEGNHFNFSAAACSLIVSEKSPDSQLIDSIGRGSLTLGLSVREEALFVLAKFGSGPWRFAHYNWWINPPIMRPDPLSEAETIYSAPPIAVVLVDSDSGIVKVVRSVKPPVEFTKHLLYETEAQIVCRFDPWRYMDVVQEALGNDSLKHALVRDAVCVCMCDARVCDPYRPLGAIRSSVLN